jgi:8-oxo-dGTP diphosphatase
MPEAEFTYSHPRPIVAADSTIFTIRDGALQVLLIRRGHDPYVNCWALPGGFVNENEPLDTAAARELHEETGLANLPLRQMATFGDPGRDPRGWAVSVVYLALIDHREHRLTAGDDANEAEWHSLNHLPALAFDHDTIIAYAVRSLREAAVSRAGELIPPTYSVADREALAAALNP